MKTDLHCIRSTVVADHQLVVRCLGGDSAAWQQMYAEYNEPLLVGVSSFLGPGSSRNRAEEVVARVWYVLVVNDFDLLRRFNVRRNCRLKTYLTAIARHQTLNYVRAEKRRRSKEESFGTIAISSEPRPESALAADEVVDCLTPRERQFLRACFESDSAMSQQFSASNIRKLRSRIQRKIRSHFRTG